jgi:hypothetical protein
MSLLTSLANASLVGGAASGVSKPVLSASRPIVEEGDEVQFILYVPDGVEGATYEYSITGITADDLFYGTLTGNFTLNAAEGAQVSIILARDSVQEIETITMTVDSLDVSVQVTITDTSPAPVGEQIYDTAGTYQWVCPAGVTKVSAVAIGPGGNGAQVYYNQTTTKPISGGGGGLGWKNNIAVTPGQTYTVRVGTSGTLDSYFISTSTVRGGYGGNGSIYPTSAAVGGSYTGDGGGNGGSSPITTQNANISGAGGAGGWNSSGGSGGYNLGAYGSTAALAVRSGTSSTNGGGGGSYGYFQYAPGYVNDYSGQGGRGGGNHLFGITSPTYASAGGVHGSNIGAAGQSYPNTSSGVFGYGGFSAGYKYSYSAAQLAGGKGGVRIMWGEGRAFPYTAEYREWDGNPTVTLVQTINSPTPKTDGRFGDSISISGKYVLIGARYEGSNKGRAHIFDMTNWQLVHTLGDSTIGGSFPGFGYSSDIEGNYAAVGSYGEPGPAAEYDAGVVRVYDVTSGNLLYTIQNPTQTKANDWFGQSLRISGIYLIVGSWRDGDVGGSNSGTAHVFDMSTGNLVSTIDNPSSTPAEDQFGWSVAISGNYAIIGAPEADSGKVYIFDITNGTLIKTLDNQTAFGFYGRAVAISGNYLIVGAHGSDTGGYSGKVYIYRTTSGDWSDAILLHSISNPNPDGDGTSDSFGMSVAIFGNYAVASARGENNSSGKAYIFDVTNGTLIKTLDNPSAGDDTFGSAVAISGNYIGVAALFEDSGGTDTGAAYIYKLT